MINEIGTSASACNRMSGEVIKGVLVSIQRIKDEVTSVILDVEEVSNSHRHVYLDIEEWEISSVDM